MAEKEPSSSEIPPATQGSTESTSALNVDETNKTAAERDAFEANPGALPGWRFWCTMFGVYAGMFLVQLEMTIASTAIVPITNDLGDFQHATWIANAYFLAWSGFLILWAQFSHTIGRKTSMLLSVGLFIIFSAGCAAAQTATQLIILRAFQGMAGAGVFTLPIMIVSEAVPPSSMPKYTAFNALVSVLAFGVGPLIGGAITDNTTWRWVFIINVPLGAVMFVLNLIGIPAAFPHHNKDKSEQPKFKISSMKHIDWIGGTLFLAAAVLIVTALEESGISFAWSSSVIICLVVFSAVAFVAFVFWERHVSSTTGQVIPVFTWKLTSRKATATLWSSGLIGSVFIIALIQIPQRLQVVNGFSPFQAGVRLLPFVLLTSVGVVIGSAMCGKFKIPFAYVSLAGALIQLAAAVAFAVVPATDASDNGLPGSQYAMQVFLGLGSGIAYVSNFASMPYCVGGQKALVAPAMGTNTQLRYLGGAIGLGIVTAAMAGYTRSHLSAFLNDAQVTQVLQASSTIARLDPASQVLVLQTFEDGFALQWKIVCGLVGAQIVAILTTF